MLLLHKMTGMRKLFFLGVMTAVLLSGSFAIAQKDTDKENEPTSWLYFSVVKDDNGKPVRNAAVILHPVDAKGKQQRGDLELKTDPDGKTNLDGIPYGPLRVQVLAHGFQTYGEDFDISKPKIEITIKLKRPQGQFSIYDDHAKDPQPKQETPPSDQQKPN